MNAPISADLAANGMATLGQIAIDGETLYWIELRPSNQGRSTLVKKEREESPSDITSKEFDVRSRVHEYGGGSFAVANGIIYASNGKDHAIYTIEPGKSPQRLTAGQIKKEDKWEGTRFGDMIVTSKGLIAVGEDHNAHVVENFLALIDTKTGAYKKIAKGCDFYASPTLSADGKKLAWISWNHPHMPWQHSELWVADVQEDGSLSHPMRIGCQTEESCLQPTWGKDGTLYFISDRSNWWNLYTVDCNTKTPTEQLLFALEGEIGEPLWVLGKSTYALADDDTLVFAYNQLGRWHLGRFDLKSKKLIGSERSSASIQQVRSSKKALYWIEGYVDQGEQILERLNDSSLINVIYAPAARIDYPFSQPTHVELSTCYGYYYPPCNPTKEPPPLIIMIHGGPTAQAKSSFSLRHQYWTSRGFALFDVNYRGSTGYGRKYRELLREKWGIIDVEDCMQGALELCRRGLADKDRLFIRGGSAGGYATLRALTLSPMFKAAASYYGIADLAVLAQDTHKFESCYNDWLIGPYQATKEEWEARSPIYAVEKISTPLILFQGKKDAVVPESQSLLIHQALQKRGVLVEICIYPEEGHGFRSGAAVADALEKEYRFYSFYIRPLA